MAGIEPVFEEALFRLEEAPDFATGTLPVAPIPVAPFPTDPLTHAVRDILDGRADRALTTLGGVEGAVACRVRGNALFLLGRLDEAAASLGEALAGGEDWRLLRTCGSVEFARGHLEAAAESYRRSHSLSGSAEVRRNFARVRWAQGHVDEANAIYEALATADPANVDILRTQGHVAMASGAPGPAARHYERALAISPDSAVLGFCLGSALYRAGRTAEAAGHLGRSLDRRATAPTALALRRVLAEQGDAGAVAAGRDATALAVAELPNAGSEARLRYPADIETWARAADISLERRPFPVLGSASGPPDHSLVTDRLFIERGLLLAPGASASVSYERVRNTSNPILPDLYLCEKPYERPCASPRSRSYYWPPFSGMERPDWLHDTTDLPRLSLDGPGAYLGGSANVGHFLIDILGKAFVLDAFDRPADQPVHVHDFGPYHRDIFTALFPDRRVIDLTPRLGEACLLGFERIDLPGNPPYAFTAAMLIRRLAELHPASLEPRPTRRLYLTRRNYRPDRHRIGNEDEVAAFLAGRGFEVIAPEELGFLETVALFRSAAILVVPAGAACVNELFCHPGTLLVELTPSYHRPDPSWQTNACLGRYAGVRHVLHYGETVAVSRAGTANNWLSRHDPSDVWRLIGENLPSLED